MRAVHGIGVVFLCVFIMNVLLAGPVGLSYTVTGSMSPEIAPGDAMVTTEVDAPGQGDIIIFPDSTGDGYVVHRIVGVEGEGFITKGDANEVTDQRAGHPAVNPDAVEGKVVTVGGTPITVPVIGLLIDSYQPSVVMTLIMFCLGIVAVLFHWLTTILSRLVGQWYQDTDRPFVPVGVLAYDPVITVSRVWAVRWVAIWIVGVLFSVLIGVIATPAIVPVDVSSGGDERITIDGQDYTVEGPVVVETVGAVTLQDAAKTTVTRQDTVTVIPDARYTDETEQNGRQTVRGAVYVYRYPPLPSMPAVRFFHSVSPLAVGGVTAVVFSLFFVTAAAGVGGLASQYSSG
jgi:signal peptidase